MNSETMPLADKAAIADLKRQLDEAGSEIQRLNDIQAIFRMWLRLRQKLWPASCNGIQLKGIDLVSLEIDIAGVVSLFLQERLLEQTQIECLYYCIECINIVLPDLQGYEIWYFTQLKTLSSSIVEYEKRWNEIGQPNVS